ncbi:MAG: hypothetical protein HYV63_01895 [Candidatus Schekmanbacteria bacterium]|nr:hypothetical protein [Candidatus Schekmanbacteria bacterium]
MLLLRNLIIPAAGDVCLPILEGGAFWPSLMQHIRELQSSEHNGIRHSGAVAILPVPWRADLLVVFEQAGAATLAVILEVQLARDENKRRSWPN